MIETGSVILKIEDYEHLIECSRIISDKLYGSRYVKLYGDIRYVGEDEAKKELEEKNRELKQKIRKVNNENATLREEIRELKIKLKEKGEILKSAIEDQVSTAERVCTYYEVLGKLIRRNLWQRIFRKHEKDCLDY